MSAIPQSNEAPGHAALGPSHGYRFEGDVAFLNAELRVAPPAHEDADAHAYALQLWACDAPHDGGRPSGIKVAEAELPRSPEPPPHLEARTVAHLPPAQRDYAMVLVLASGARGVYDQVLDYANYAAPQRFVAPHLEGRVGYRIDGADLVLEAERVLNPRAADNLSGTLSLELWAHDGDYAGGAAHGTRLGQVELPRLAGQSTLETVVGRAALQQPPPGSFRLTLMLREWTAAEGYRTRDFRDFTTPYTVAAPVAAPVAAAPADAQVVAPPRRAAPKRAPAKPAESAPVSIQRAPIEALARVPGLNARLAAAIVRQRPFKSLEELTKVRGIGDKLLRTLRPHLTV
ncbi:MAG: helix-hairpin-helix domain-containing protein [Polyangiales bacterium]